TRSSPAQPTPISRRSGITESPVAILIRRLARRSALGGGAEDTNAALTIYAASRRGSTGPTAALGRLLRRVAEWRPADALDRRRRVRSGALPRLRGWGGRRPGCRFCRGLGCRRSLSRGLLLGRCLRLRCGRAGLLFHFHGAHSTAAAR